MSKREEKVLGLELPAKRELESIEPALEAINELAARRDVLRMISRRALDEAESIQRSIDEAVRGQQRELAALAAQVGAR